VLKHGETFPETSAQKLSAKVLLCALLRRIHIVNGPVPLKKVNDKGILGTENSAQRTVYALVFVCFKPDNGRLNREMFRNSAHCHLYKGVLSHQIFNEETRPRFSVL
jgi:hypothetical protein